MKNQYKLVFMFLFSVISIMPIKSLNAYSKKSSFGGYKTTKSYVKKPPYAGFGKKSSVNGLIKTKGVSGHFKRTSKRYSFVNSYSRSK